VSARTHMTPARTRKIRAARTEDASRAIGPVTPGLDVFILTHGQFSLIDAIVYLSQQIGPCVLSVSTWTAGAEDLSKMADLLSAGSFTGVRWLVDRSFVNRQPAYCARMRDLFGDDCIRTTRSHAKFVTLRNDDFNLAVRTSMNLNHNPRLENIEISDDAAFADFLDVEFDRYFDTQEEGVLNADLRGGQHTLGLSVGRASTTRIYGSNP
jgi:hypothetical protein